MTSIYVAVNTLALFAVRQWFVPFVKAQGERVARVKAELADELGREPTGDELHQRLMELHD